MTKEERQYEMDRLTDFLQDNKEKLYRLAYQYVKNEELALDCISEATYKALDKITLLRHTQYLKTWFYRILINECLGKIKKKARQKEIQMEDYDIQAVYEIENQEEILDLYEKINQLSPKLKTVILLRYFEDMKLQEITKITKTNLSTVKSRLYKALKELKIGIIEEEKDETTSNM